MARSNATRRPKLSGSTRKIKRASPAELEDADALVVPGGFGERGVEGKIEAIRIARETGLPFLGLCLGLADRRHRIRA